DVFEALIECIKADDWAIRSIAAKRLKNFTNPQAFQYLEAALLDSPDTSETNKSFIKETRSHILEALVALPGPNDQVGTRIWSALKQGDYSSVRGEGGGAGRYLKIALKAFRRTYFNPARVAWALGEIGDPTSATDLLAVLSEVSENEIGPKDGT